MTAAGTRTMLAAAAAIALAACDSSTERAAAAPPTAGERTLVAAPHRFQAGPPDTMLTVSANPLGNNREAWAEGKRLYSWFNCAGCHGTLGGGGIGPPLRDEAWIYGSDPADVFQSIAQGRPKGMPTFGHMIPDEQIWMLVSYVHSLGGGGPEAGGGTDMGEARSQ